MLVVLAIVSILMALLIPAARGAIGSARSFKCQMAQRSVAFDFQVWADESLRPPRGNDDLPLAQGGAGKGRFFLETFQEAQYGIDEFWKDNTTNVVRLPDRSGRDPMRCVEVKGDLTLTRFAPCSQGGVSPAANVSFGFNIRLHWSDTLLRSSSGYQVGLTSSVLDGYGQVSPSALPLLMDVDGAAAAARDRTPVFTGPLLNGDPGLYDGYWFPGLRHNGAANVAFIDGHVAASKAPDREPNWAWGFTPSR